MCENEEGSLASWLMAGLRELRPGVLSCSCTHHTLHAHMPNMCVSLCCKRAWMELGKLRTLWEDTSPTLTHRGCHCEPLNSCKKPVGYVRDICLLLGECYFPEGFSSRGSSK